jgi:hypothetical protein
MRDVRTMTLGTVLQNTETVMSNFGCMLVYTFIARLEELPVRFTYTIIVTRLLPEVEVHAAHRPECIPNKAPQLE